jgi:hypothetical protein
MSEMEPHAVQEFLALVGEFLYDWISMMVDFFRVVRKNRPNRMCRFIGLMLLAFCLPFGLHAASLAPSTSELRFVRAAIGT